MKSKKPHAELKTGPQKATQVGKPEKDEHREDISVQIMMLSHRKALVRCSSCTKALLHPCYKTRGAVFSMPGI